MLEKFLRGGVNVRGVFVLGGNCPGGICPGVIVRGVIVLIPNYIVYIIYLSEYHRKAPIPTIDRVMKASSRL